MNPGEPLQKNKDADSDRADAIVIGPPARNEDTDADEDRNAMFSDTADFLSRTFGEADYDDDEIGTEDEALLDREVRSLLDSIAEEESEHDEAWVEASRREDMQDDHGAERPDRDDAEPVAPVAETPDAHPEPQAETGAGHGAADDPPDPSGTVDTPMPATVAGDTPPPPVDIPPAPVAPVRVAPVRVAPARDAPNDHAISVLSEKFEAAEARNGEALDRIGHALGMIATRIDGLESRATDRTIADVAFLAAPPEYDDEDDASVAPYIARAEKELKAKKESGSMDIFDRIARAAEDKFDDGNDGTRNRVLENASDGRRVGTKRWQPSRAVKKRMELLEKKRAEEQPVERPAPVSRKLRVEDEDVPTARSRRVEEPVAPPPEIEEDAGFEPEIEMHEEEDAGLSVVPGARGRRRNRARKSALDSDFENVFTEEGDKPSIQSLRRKMRERPVEAPETEGKSKGGMLGGFLARKSAQKTDPVLDDGDAEDEDLMSAFETGDAAPAAEMPAKPAKVKKAAKAKPVEIDEDDEDDEDWEDDEAAISGSRRKLLVYGLIVAAAAAGFAVWKMFLA